MSVVPQKMKKAFLLLIICLLYCICADKSPVAAPNSKENENVWVKTEHLQRTCTNPSGVRGTAPKPYGIDVSLQEYSCPNDEYDVLISNDGSLVDYWSLIWDLGDVIYVRNLLPNTTYSLCIKRRMDGIRCLFAVKFVTDSLNSGIELSYFEDDDTKQFYLRWMITDEALLRDIHHFEIRWIYKKNECPSSQIQNSTTLHRDEVDYYLSVEPYSTYYVDLEIHCRSSGLITQSFGKGGSIQSKFSETIERSEIPQYDICPPTTNVTLYIGPWNCKFVAGPLLAFYDITINHPNVNANRACCELINDNKRTSIVGRNELVIPGLKPNCDYTIRMRYARNRTHEGVPGPPILVRTEEEMPSISHIDTTTNFTAKVFFTSSHCVYYAPFKATYFLSNANETNVQEYWCSYKWEQRNIVFPLNELSIDHSGLITYCSYVITIFKEGEERVPFERRSFKTKPSIFAPRVKNLKATAQGPSGISLRWSPPPPTTGELKGYRIDVNGKYVYSNESITWCSAMKANEYHHCHDVPKRYLDMTGNKAFTIKVFAYNHYEEYEDVNLDRESKTTREFATIRVCACETPPPSDVTTTWTSNYQLNVTWKSPISDPEKRVVQRFLIHTNVTQNDHPGTVKVSEVLVRDNNYFEFVFVPVKNNLKLETVEACVAAEYETINSTCSQAIIRPPPPREYAGQVYFHTSLVVERPAIDEYFLMFYVFAADATDDEASKPELEAELLQLSQEIENKSYNQVLHSGHYSELFHSDDEYRRLDKSDVTLAGQFVKGTTYQIALVIVNELNGIRTVKVVSTTAVTKRGGNRKPYVNAPLAVAVGMLLLCFVIIGTVGWFLYRCRRGRSSVGLGELAVLYSCKDDTVPLTSDVLVNESSAEDNDDLPITVEPTPEHSKPVPIGELRHYVKSAIELGELLRQHQLFPRSDVLQARNPAKFSCSYGNLPQNKPKNRYNNVVPYDRTLVKLEKLPDDEFSDYINANYVDGFRTPRAYIATQGPIPNTLNEFWTMIWEKRVSHVVMLTNLYDGGKKMCEQYWPEEGCYLNFNGLKVELVSATAFRTYDVRAVQLTLVGVVRKVWQIHFKAWPSSGQPLFPQTLVPLLQKMLTIPTASKSPILVHCSAGVGRTGTIILCDICLRMAAAKGSVDFLGVLERLREQRPNMVDNVEQYKLAHLVVLSALTACNTRIPLNDNFKEAIDKIFDDFQTPALLQRLKEDEWQDDAMKSVATAVQRHVPIVPEKNRFPDILPDEVCQVFLQQLPNKGYINAIRVNSFDCFNRYLVTQHPLPNTLADFWRMTLEELATVIINLNPVNEADETSVPFWPDEQHPLNLDVETSLQILHVKSLTDSFTTVHTLKACYYESGVEQTKLTVKILNFNGWRADESVPENVEDLVTFAVNAFDVCRKTSSPVIVTCYDGATASGLFVAISNLLGQMRAERVCDVYQTIRALRVCRKQFVCEEIQVQKLFVAAVAYAVKFDGTYEEVNKM